MTDRPATRRGTARLYAAVAAPRPAAPDLTRTPPPKGGVTLAGRAGRPHRAGFADLLRRLPWGRG